MDSVSVDGESVEFVTAGPELVMTLDEPLTSGDEFTVTVDYESEPAPYLPEGVPFTMGWGVIPGRRVLVHGFPGAAATWTPISESLHDPARAIIRIDVAEVAGIERSDITVSPSCVGHLLLSGRCML